MFNNTTATAKTATARSNNNIDDGIEDDEYDYYAYVSMGSKRSHSRRDAMENQHLAHWETQLPGWIDRFRERSKVARRWDKGMYVMKTFTDVGSFSRKLAVSDRYLVSGQQFCNVDVYDVQTARQLAQFTGHTESVTGVAIDGDIIFSSSGDRTLRAWSMDTKECLAVRHDHTAPIMALRLFHDRLFTASLDGVVRVWNKDTLEHPITLSEAYPTGINDIVASDRFIVAALDSGSVFIWDAGTLDPHGRPEIHTSVVTALGIDGNELISGSMDGTVKITELVTGQPLMSIAITEHRNGVTCLDFDERRIVCGIFEHVCIVDRRSGYVVNRIYAHPCALVRDLIIADDVIFTAGFNRRIATWSFRAIE